MKKAALLALFTLYSSCAGYFGQNTSQPVMQADRLVSPAIAGGGYLSTDEYNEICPFVYNSRIDGSRWLYFSSDRTGHYRIYRARMLSNGQFQAPERLNLPDMDTDGLQITCPLVFETIVGSQTNVMLTVLWTFGQAQQMRTFVLDTTNYFHRGIETPLLSSIGLYMEYDAGYFTPTVLAMDRSRKIFQYGYSDISGWQPDQPVLYNMDVYSGNGFQNSYRPMLPAVLVASNNSSRIFVFETGGGRLGISISQPEDQNLKMTMIIPGYNKGYVDSGPYCDYEDGYKVYFASTRNGRGNYDLYRYNTMNLATQISNSLTGFIPNLIENPGVYVSLNGDDANSGYTPQDPVKTFTRAMDILTNNNIYYLYAAEGVYNYSNSFINSYTNNALWDISFDDGLTFIGGFSPDFLRRTGRTVIDGEFLRPVLYANSSSDMFFDGFTFLNAAGDNALYFLLSAGITVSNCSIINGKVNTYAPLAFQSSSDIIIADTLIASNIANESYSCAIYFENSDNAALTRTLMLGNNGTNMAVVYIMRNISSLGSINFIHCTIGGRGSDLTGIQNVGLSGYETPIILSNNLYLTDFMPVLYSFDSAGSTNFSSILLLNLITGNGVTSSFGNLASPGF